MTAPEPLIPISILASPIARCAIVANAFGWGSIVGLNFFFHVSAERPRDVGHPRGAEPHGAHGHAQSRCRSRRPYPRPGQALQDGARARACARDRMGRDLGVAGREFEPVVIRTLVGDGRDRLRPAAAANDGGAARIAWRHINSAPRSAR